MSTFERIFGALKTIIELRGDVDRLSDRLDKAGDLLFDHERRLVRLETLEDVRRADVRQLPTG